MLSPQDHLEQAENNELAARSVGQAYPDWAITMYFYAALHWVERYARSEGADIKNDYPDGHSPHECRRMYIKDVAHKLRNRILRKAYEDLERESRKARYLEGLNSNAKTYYTQKMQNIIDSSQNLQKVKQLLQ